MAYSLLVRNAATIELLRKHLWALPFLAHDGFLL